MTNLSQQVPTSKHEGGRMRVFARVRPFSPKEVDRCSTCAVSINECEALVHVGSDVRKFVFDRCFESLDPASESFGSQCRLYDEVAVDAVNAVVSGVDGGVLAYGNGGTGKTYTLTGPAEDPGLIIRAAEDLLRRRVRQEEVSFDSDASFQPFLFEDRADLPAGAELRVWASYCEIRNENVRDLLGSRGSSNLRVAEHPTLGVLVPGLTEVPCGSVEDVLELLDCGAKMRVASSTMLCSDPSRGHTVFTFRVQVHHQPSGPAHDGASAGRVVSAKLHFADLAAAERAPHGIMPPCEEGQLANGVHSSLFGGRAASHGLVGLHLVLRALSKDVSKSVAEDQNLQPERYAPFRSCKLTAMLRDALSSRSALVVTVAPSACCVAGTLRTLEFASSARGVVLDPAIRRDNFACEQDYGKALTAEVHRLRSLALGRGSNASAGSLHLGVSQLNFGQDQGDLQQELADREVRLAQLVQPFALLLDEAANAKAIRQAALGEQCPVDDDPTFANDVYSQPVLLNISDDANLAGRLAYTLGPGPFTTVGSHPDNGIVITGLGICSRLCQFICRDNGDVVLTLSLSAGPRSLVWINGRPLQSGEEHVLQSLDWIVFGRARAVCIAINAGAPAADAEREKAQDICYCEDMLKLLSPEESDAWGELRLYFTDLRERLGTERSKEFFSYLAEGSHLVDEANEITAEMRPQSHLKYEVELVWDINREVRDIIVIRSMQSAAPTEFAPPVLGYWVLPRFRERVELMRDCYDTVCRLGSWPGLGDPLQDPWLNPSAVEVELQMHVRMQEAKELNKLRTDSILSSTKVGQPQSGGRRPGIASTVASTRAPRLSAAAPKSKSPRPGVRKLRGPNASGQAQMPRVSGGSDADGDSYRFRRSASPSRGNVGSGRESPTEATEGGFSCLTTGRSSVEAPGRFSHYGDSDQLVQSLQVDIRNRSAAVDEYREKAAKLHAQLASLTKSAVRSVEQSNGVITGPVTVLAAESAVASSGKPRTPPQTGKKTHINATTSVRTSTG